MKHIRIQTDKITGTVSPWLRGACMEDVNHELYGGIWSQMIFGESFAEPAESGMDTERLNIFGTTWDIEGDRVTCGREGSGPKLIFSETAVKDCTVSFMTLKMKVEFEEGADVDSVMKNVRTNCKKVEDDCEIYL